MQCRPLRTLGDFGCCALCIFLSTVILQVLTMSCPPSILGLLSLVDSSLGSYAPAGDLSLHNLSVQHVRYLSEPTLSNTGVDDDKIQANSSCKFLVDSIIAMTTRSLSTEISSAVLTWEDHPLAAHMRSRLNDDKMYQESAKAVDFMDLGAYSYEVQMWVAGWGLDAFWHPTNKLVITKDPFLVLRDIPEEHEVKFRARLKTKCTLQSLLEFLLPIDFRTIETDGPWSDAVTLSPTRNGDLDAIVVSLVDNKPLLVLLTVCIGLGCLVIAQLYIRQSRKQKGLQNHILRRSNFHDDDAAIGIDAGRIPGKSLPELEREIRNLRQELADSEDEVRKLMLFSGYGIESLSPSKLEQLEGKLKHTLQRIYYYKKNEQPQ